MTDENNPVSRLKKYEENGKDSVKIDDKTPLIARIVGKQFPAGFNKPYDERIHSALCRATADIVQNFHAATGYTHGQEIHLVFPSRREDTDKQPYIETCQLITTLASFASMRFMFHLSKINFEEDEANLDKRIHENPRFHFNATIFNVPTKTEALNHFVNISNIGAKASSVKALATIHFKYKEIITLGTHSLIRKLQKEREVCWDHYPVGFKHGTFVKRVQNDKVKFHVPKDEDVEQDIPQDSERPQLVMKPFNLEFEPRHIEFLFEEFWPNIAKQILPPQNTEETGLDAKKKTEIVLDENKENTEATKCEPNQRNGHQEKNTEDLVGLIQIDSSLSKKCA